MIAPSLCCSSLGGRRSNLGLNFEAIQHFLLTIGLAAETIDFRPDGTGWPLSVSIGGAAYITRAQFSDLYRLADQRLYEAKNTGRDRVALMQAA